MLALRTPLQHLSLRSMIIAVCAPWLLALWAALLTGLPTLPVLPHLRPSALWA